MGGSFLFWMSTTSTSISTTRCEALVLSGSDDTVTLPLTQQEQQQQQLSHGSDNNHNSLRSKVKRVLRMIRRIFKLILVFTPVAALYPLHWMIQMGYNNNNNNNNNPTSVDAQQLVLDSLEQGKIPDGILGWYYRVLLNAVELSGAALIKIMQWAGSRPDMFGQDFCAVFSQLQDDTTPHAWKHTERALIEAYGEKWQDHVEIGGLLGSGCIAQVYKGFITDSTTGAKRPVAIKVMHPNVEDDIDADLDILRVTVRLMERLNFGPLRDLKWLNLPGFIEEMAVMLKIQLDLRTEGQHLQQFNKNFQGNDAVVFPKVVQEYPPVKNVLVETFCEGVPIMDFIKNNKADRELLTKMCTGAIRAVCQMIFIDNFTHGDLHPGNVLVSKDFKFVLLDVGIVTQHSQADHRLISNVLAAFIRCDGRRAGQLMIEDSDSRLAAAGDHSVDEEGFLRVIESITMQASGKEYLMEKLGTYITQICNAASTHHVMLNQAFISAALAVKVQEGIALALDPSIEIWRIAIPIILEGERRHRTEQAKELLLGFEDILDWLSGGKRKEKQAMEERKRKAMEYNLRNNDSHHHTSNAQIMGSN
ncbi:2-octaprenylphenol hydroxylase [Nitzschia inconspicua]|uniref:2-octaprenylphenol hydroxylase n=1 Tax=Nitzschia inconspicua TaxID=303405 RepID=A0A9K3K9I0_9STRA|nr:2-octaprenylphenol hydroxylase [Nitzschia inconspicua]KAG7340079.1 2-octaprenylphenol hydroxylase [Nitzschia inconspicua]